MPAEAPRSVADQLAASLEQQAELVDHGALAIDAELALAKLGRYQLVDPYSYVLRLAEAGVRLGADALWFWSTHDSLIAHFARAGEPVVLDASTLENLLTVLLAQTERSGSDRGALVQLAVAANAARQLAPEQLWIESVDAQGRGHRLTLESKPVLEAVCEGTPGLWFRLRQRPAARVARLRARLGGRPEVELLRERACWAWTPIYVDNHRISHGFRLPDSAPILDAQGQQIGVGLVGGADITAPACVVLFAFGIEVERVYPDGARPGYFALVAAGLERDLSFARFVRGPAFDELLARALGVQASAAALVPQRGNSSVRRRETRRGRIKKGVSFTLAAANIAMMFVGVALMAENLAVLGTLLSMTASPLLVLYGHYSARGGSEVVAPKASRSVAADRRAPALPPASTSLALPAAEPDR